MSNQIPSFTIGTLFERDDAYVIPIYQRNYTWGLGEITQLIRDIYDYAFDEKKASANYYLGTLVVYERHKDGQITYETIDGQQRLTTLILLINALNRKNVHRDLLIDSNLKLKFDSRNKSTETLKVITNKNQKEVAFISNKEYNPQIQQGYIDAEKILKRYLNSEDKLNIFYAYFINKVKIVRVSVPEQTNLNHYFEIMNNRGEQLEKHEILKANLLEVLSDYEDLTYTFNKIWEACADMERYVQYGFSTKQRDIIFTDNHWNLLKFNSLDELASKIFNEANKINASKINSIDEIINHKGSFESKNEKNDDTPERFSSVINFSNFLLHVLRIQTETDVALDDKRLIDSFDEILDQLDKYEKIEFVKLFGFNLLKIKHLFDQYIIKREFIRETDHWSLKVLKWYNGNKVSYVNSIEHDEGLNRELIMLLSMFHVSTPTLAYKHWLNGALYFLFNQVQFDAENYKKYLLNLAKSYLFDRFIAVQELDYFQIIYENKGISQNRVKGLYDMDLLDKGTAVENFVFNYLDYILWKEGIDGSTTFDFTFRSSVEHYYPQNPISKAHKIDQRIYDMFGNLCLISSNKNSRLSNHMPQAKKDYYHRVGADSLKQKIMMSEPNWEINEITSHTRMMKSKLKNF